MESGNSPQLWWHSYLCSPSPTTGDLVSALRVMPKSSGPAEGAATVAAARWTKVRRCMRMLQEGANDPGTGALYPAGEGIARRWADECPKPERGLLGTNPRRRFLGVRLRARFSKW